MKRLALTLALIGVASAPVAAQTSISGTAQFGPLETVVYAPFTVSLGGSFTMETFGSNLIDPYIMLFSGTAHGGGQLLATNYLAENDDGGTASGNYSNSRIANFGLGIGSYTLVLSSFHLDVAEAVAGNQTAWGTSGCDDDGNWSDCSYTYSITSQDGTARSTEVPEPMAALLLASGLAGVGFIGMRRRQDEDEVA